MNRSLIALAALATATLAATGAAAASFSGTFAQDNGKAGFFFYVTAPTVVSITSTGFSAGGFDPVLSLYDADGLAIDYNDDQAEGNFDPQLIRTDLTTGRYTVYLTQYDNFGPASLALPFAFDDQPNFRGGFVDFYENQRTGSWALDITGTGNVGGVPEPASWAMLIAGFGLLGAAQRRRRSAIAA